MTKGLKKSWVSPESERFAENQLAIWDDVNFNNGDKCPRSRCVRSSDFEYYKMIPCDREDCKVCGRKGSMLHKRRVMRGIKKILACSGVGYFVFSIPMEHRVLFREQSALNKVMYFVKGLVKDKYAYKRGVMRFHWGGEKHRGVYNPHLNMLVDLGGGGGWLSESVLNEIKESYKEFLYQEFDIEIKDNGLPVVNYTYARSVGKMINKWKYICCPTLLYCKDPWSDNQDEFYELVGDLYNYRNTRWFGVWSKEELDAIESLDKRDSEVADVLNDENIVWVYAGKWEDIENEVMEKYEYLGSGLFKRVGFT